MWSNFLKNGAGDAKDPVFLRKIAIINSYSLLGVIFLFAYGIINLQHNQTFVGYIEIAACGLALINLYILRLKRDDEIASSIMLYIIIFVTGYLFLSGGIAESGRYWIYILPPVAYALKGKRAGNIWVAISLFMIISIFALEFNNIIPNPYTSFSPVNFLHFLTSYICISLTAFCFQYFQEQADYALEKQKNLLQTILDNLPVGVKVVKPLKDKPIIENPVAKILDGKNLVKADGSIYPHDELPLNITLKTKNKISKDDIYKKTADGKTHTIRGISAPVFNIKDEFQFAVGVFEDITHEKEVDRMKSEFISLASHQLLTPLTAIKAQTELLILYDGFENLSPKQQKHIQNIKEIDLRMIELVSSLLDISRLESGKIIPEPSKTDLPKLIDEVLTDVKIKFDEKQQDFRINIIDKIPEIEIDQKLIRQVYLNLLTNASKYTPEKGSIVLTIEEREKDVLSKVTDSGYGIPEKDKAKVFQKFYRGDNIVSIVSEGTGLGLYLIKTIVDVSGGTIGYDSKEGAGTTFWFTLPKKAVVLQN